MLREVRPEDLTQLTHLANVGMEHDHFFDALIHEKTLGSPDYDPALCLCDEGDYGRLRGFLAGAVGDWKGVRKGWIRLLTVSPACRNQGVATALLAEFEKRAIARGAKVFTVMDVPTNYYMPGVDPLYTEATIFLPRRGFERGPKVNENLICDIWPGRFDCSAKIRELAAQGYEIRRATPADEKAIVAFLGGEFPGWEREALNALQNVPPTLHLCWYQGEVIAFAAAEGNNRGTGWFGPMGTKPAARGKGIGEITLQLCLEDLAALGHRQAIIPWGGPVGFYMRFCGARRHRTFWTYEKRV